MLSLLTSTPLPDAADQLARRALSGSTLTSAEWELVPAEIRLRSMFSARVQSENLLQEFKDRLETRINQDRTAGGVIMDRSLFVRQMREHLDATGYRPDPKHAGGLRDLTSQKRLGLIWQMNIDQAQGFAAWKAAMDPDVLHAFPVMEFVRLAPRAEIRPWAEIWAGAGGKFYGRPGPDYPLAKGRMMARRTDIIWMAINRFGVPWKPFDWGSGMGTRNIRRSQALALGVIRDDDPPQEPQIVPYNANHSASLANIPPDRRRAIEDALCGDVEIDGDTIRILPPQEPFGTFAIATPPPSLTDTAAKARRALKKLSADDLARVMQPVRNTVAYRRLAADAKAAGTTLDDSETAVRAIMQFMAMSSGLSAAIREMRLGDSRESVWTEMDFSDVFSTLSSLLGGAA